MEADAADLFSHLFPGRIGVVVVFRVGGLHHVGEVVVGDVGTSLLADEEVLWKVAPETLGRKVRMPLPEEIVMVEMEKMLLLLLSDRLLSFSVSAVALEPLPELLSDITPAVLTCSPKMTNLLLIPEPNVRESGKRQQHCLNPVWIVFEKRLKTKLKIRLSFNTYSPSSIGKIQKK